jgi:hypothetical protein
MQVGGNCGAVASVGITCEHAGSKNRAESVHGNVEVNQEE